MSKWNKEELENMLKDVVNELDLSEAVIEKHGPLGTAPAELVKLVLEQKDKQIAMLKTGMKQIEHTTDKIDNYRSILISFAQFHQSNMFRSDRIDTIGKVVDEFIQINRLRTINKIINYGE